MPNTHAARELWRVFKAGPHPEDYYRLKVAGNVESLWINVTADQLNEIVKVLTS